MKKHLALIFTGIGIGITAPALANVDLAKQRGCLACHAVERKIVGPSFQEISRKYAGSSAAEDLLVGRVKGGTKGTWGPVPMPPNNQVPISDIKTIVGWILAGAPVANTPTIKPPTETLTMGKSESTLVQVASNSATATVANTEKIGRTVQTGSCPTSHRFFSGDNPQGEHEVIFSPLLERIKTKAQLEEIYNSARECALNPPAKPTIAAQYFIDTVKEEGSPYFVRDITCFRDDDPDEKTRYPSILLKRQLSKKRYEAYECHRQLGWPSAIDYTSPLQKGNVATRANSHPVPSEDSGVSKATQAEELAAKHAAAFARFSNLMDKDGVSGATGETRKKVIARQYPKCLEMVDIRRDKNVPAMVWYAIRNKCGESLRAYWCEGEGCSRMTKSWEIQPGQKETTWLTQKDSRQIRLHATACPSSVNGVDVYYDFEKNQCWHWGSW